MGRGYARSRCTASAPETLRGILLVMARLILLDSGPLGLIVRAPSKPQVVRCLTWLKAASATGAIVVIPEIADYEVRRELLRIRAVGSLGRLERYLDPSSGLAGWPRGLLAWGSRRSVLALSRIRLLIS